MARIRSTRWYLTLGVLLLSLVVVATASAHLERPSYWPDPAADTSVTPAAGGGVPVLRSLSSAVWTKGAKKRRIAAAKRAMKRRAARRRAAVRAARRGGPRALKRVKARNRAGRRRDARIRRRLRRLSYPSDTLVVCQGEKGADSLRLALASIEKARETGYVLRPSQPVIKYGAYRVKHMTQINQRLAKLCKFDSVQDAVDAAGNNDRIVIMPGTYTEPESRAQPENDPRCNPSLLQKDASGDPTPSYEYQVTCPHDQNLIYVQGRAVKGKPLAEPRSDRRGIPEQELGACVRCNLQIEGSGPSPDDVILDAGENYEGSGPEARPGDHAKDVVLRADRTDGFVGRNFLMRGAREHGFYTEESDGVLLDRTKFFWNADYGHLAFTSDHQRVQNCDGMGAGDAAIYPGAAPETGSQTTKDFYPGGPRMNTTITKCDMRNSALGYSGSMGNAVRITENHIYGNTAGIASDTLSSAGHPGFPTDGTQIDHNLIYSNNFNVYSTSSPVKPLVTVPIGTGVIYAGVNDARVHDNWFFDNWRYATMLFAVPDALTSYGGPEGDVFPGVSCEGAPENGLSTSCGNRYFNNRMGQLPPGFTFPAKLDEYGVPHGAASENALPNGTDFWWDEFTSNRWNCWYDNSGPAGGAVTGPGPAGPKPGAPPQTLPDCSGGQNRDESVGPGDPAKTQYLISCSEGPNSPAVAGGCDWYTPPPKPGSQEAAALAGIVSRASREFERSPEGRRLRERMDALAAGAGG